MSEENTGEKPHSRPNIVLIVADQWRGDCIGFLGHPLVKTPNIDKLFSVGVTFTQAYSAVPSCIAARAALLTGLSQNRHGRVGYQDGVLWNYPVTLPGLLSNAGYNTHCVGKMHVFPRRNLMGFHSVVLHDGCLPNGYSPEDDCSLVDDYLPWLRKRCGYNISIEDAGIGCDGYSVKPWPYKEQYHSTNWVTNQSIAFLKKCDPDIPFFLEVSYHRPHPPLDPPRRYLNRYLNKGLPPVAMGDWTKDNRLSDCDINGFIPKNKSQIDLARRAYFAHLTHIDCQFKRLIHALKKYCLWDNTLIMFISDHGEMLFDHNLLAKIVGYAGSIKIPFLLRLPDSWSKPKNTRIEAPVELRDIMPTLLDAAGIDIHDNIDGSSVLPLCYGKKIQWRKYIHGEHEYGQKSNHWITNGREIYIWYSQTGREQYFDLETDPNNMQDLSKKRNDRVIYWRQKLIDELEDREEGYVNNGMLVIGRPNKAVLNHLS